MWGSLVLAVWEGNAWRYVGNVGRKIPCQARRAACKPLAVAHPFPIQAAGRTRDHHLVRHLVPELKFTEWTDAGELRHPRFQGMRDDKEARDVVREGP